MPWILNPQIPYLAVEKHLNTKNIWLWLWKKIKHENIWQWKIINKIPSLPTQFYSCASRSMQIKFCLKLDMALYKSTLHCMCHCGSMYVRENLPSLTGRAVQSSNIPVLYIDMHKHIIFHWIALQSCITKYITLHHIIFYYITLYSIELHYNWASLNTGAATSSVSQYSNAGFASRQCAAVISHVPDPIWVSCI